MNIKTNYLCKTRVIMKLNCAVVAMDSYHRPLSPGPPHCIAGEEEEECSINLFGQLASFVGRVQDLVVED